MLSSITQWFRSLLGNNKAATIGIFAFILVLCLLFNRCNAAEIDVFAGSSFGTEGTGAVLGLDYHQPVKANPGVDLYAGTELWGSTRYEGQYVFNNWDWHAGIEACKGKLCARIGPAYVQRVDAINGAHTNFNLGLLYEFTDRFRLNLGHISDAGTSNPNVGRQFLAVSYRLQ